jgi:hypothetical protein
MLGDLAGHDIAVIALRQRHENIGVLDARPLQGFFVNAVAVKSGAAEGRRQARKA